MGEPLQVNFKSACTHEVGIGLVLEISTIVPTAPFLGRMIVGLL
jgi:hypothetical protein